MPIGVRAGFDHMFTAATVPGIAALRSTPTMHGSVIGRQRRESGGPYRLGSGARFVARRSWNRELPRVACPCLGRCAEALAGLRFALAPGHAAAPLRGVSEPRMRSAMTARAWRDV